MTEYMEIKKEIHRKNLKKMLKTIMFKTGSSVKFILNLIEEIKENGS